MPKRQEWKKEGGPPPFFERFEDDDFMKENRILSLDFYTKDDVIASIERNVDMLLRTRSMVSREDYEMLSPEELTYGIPQLYGLLDFSSFSPEGIQSWDQSAQMIENAVRLFEPRLLSPKVMLEQFDAQTQTLKASLSGQIMIGEAVEWVQFPVQLCNIPYNQTQGRAF